MTIFWLYRIIENIKINCTYFLATFLNLVLENLKLHMLLAIFLLNSLKQWCLRTVPWLDCFHTIIL